MWANVRGVQLFILWRADRSRKKKSVFIKIVENTTITNGNVLFFFIIKIQNSNRRLLEAFNAIIMNAFERGLSTNIDQKTSVNQRIGREVQVTSRCRVSREKIYSLNQSIILLLLPINVSHVWKLLYREVHIIIHTRPPIMIKLPLFLPGHTTHQRRSCPKRPLWNSRETSEDIHYNTGMMVIVVMIHLVATLRDSIGPRQQKHNRLCPRRERGWHKRTRLM